MSAQLGYIRVSTVEQSTERQLLNIELDKIFTDKCSGKNTNRPALTQLIEFAREGDTIHCHDISRMARSTEDLLRLVKEFISEGVTLKFHKENLEFDGESNPIQDLTLALLGSIYQFERAMILERQKEGIALAKAKGKYKGKPTNEVLHQQIRLKYAEGLNKAQVAKTLGCARATVYKALKCS
jgi:DNA invertase Pin-like site-specific DNA recombinase